VSLGLLGVAEAGLGVRANAAIALPRNTVAEKCAIRVIFNFHSSSHLVQQR
jgi:hypothetical protein